MRKIFLIALLFLCTGMLHATIINVPADYATIQGGINASTNGDTVLAQPGTYIENINYDGKNITVASLFLTTQDPYYIAHTIIDGDSLDSVVRFQNGEDTTAVLTGFTVQNGNAQYGGGIFCWNNSSPRLERLVISGNNAISKGGGILCYWNSSPILKYVEITENYSYDEGGGICCNNDSSPRLDNVTISGNITSGFGGGIFCNNNSFLSLENVTISGNSSEDGGGMYCNNSSPSLENIFISGNNASDNGGGMYCSDDSSPSLDNVTISDNSSADVGGGMYCNDSSPSLVNVTISENSSEDGGGMYCSDSSPSLVNVTILGNSSSDDGGGMYLYRGSSYHLYNVIISGNSASDRGGGILCYSSSPHLENVTISGNICSDGGGIYCMSSNMSLKNVIISGNNVSDVGGGINCTSNSSPSLENVTISGNSAGRYGGGINCNYNSSLSFNATNRCNIYSNTIENMRGAGVDIYSYNSDIIDVIVDTFTVMTPTDYYASPITNFTFNILHSIEDNLINADVYVSVDGDDSNTGTSADEPFKTIRHALSMIYSDSLNINTIYLAQGVYSDSTNGEMFPLNWSDHVNLSGSDQEYTILDANNMSEIMKFNNINHAIIENITVTNGHAEYGGGIYFNNSSPCLENITISNNRATDGYAHGEGGGIFCRSSSPSLENVTISDNSAGRYGGGISCSNYSSPSLVNVTISGNSAGWFGGGIYCCYDSSPSLENVTISNNSATGSYEQGEGGGIFYNSSSPSLENVTISGNRAGRYGGGICCKNSSPSLVNVTISDNSAIGCFDAQGGGIFCNSSSPSLENVTISGNSAGTIGGGMYCYNSYPSFNATNRCNIYSNTIEIMRGFGVDIYSYNCDVIDVIVDTFTVMTPTDYYASPINQFTFDILHSIEGSLVNADVYVSVDGDDSNTGTSPDEPFKTIKHALSKIYSDSLNINTIHLTQGVFSDSTNGEMFPIHWSDYVNLSGSNQEYTILDARNMSGVMEFDNVNNVIIENITITNGNAEDGGGIYCNNSSPSLANVTISSNSATGGYSQGEGGGIFCNSSSPSLVNVTISENSAGRYGGGMYCEGNSLLSLMNVTISGNSVDGYGGGIYCYESSPILENVTISSNSATGSYDAHGGGIYCKNSSPSLVNSTISGNNASYSGGGIYCYQSSPSLENVTISSNSTTESYAQGGGVFCNSSSPSFENVTVSDNYSARGGGIYCSNSSPNIENVTISGNSASRRGSGIYCYYSSPSIINTIVSYNTGDYGIYASSSNPSITYSDFFDNEYGNFYGCEQSVGVNVTTNANGDSCDVFHNIQLDPQFADTLNGDYHLTENSPCIDAGDPNSPLDPDGTIADMGAYYYDQLSINNIVDDNEHLLFNFPNPVYSNQHSLTVRFIMRKQGNVTVQLFNIRGQLISTLVHEDKNIGEYTITCPVNELSPGIYFTRMSVDGVDKEIRKVVLLR
ncbi:MAG: right-handed parallel beta-helix repeat-containing protein [Candidatus Celaenobacter antarcticus]|nr:right-handed parallel beta-helix repeat-containing protein [Candidatus Celaenobacter antarcticus]